MNNKLLLGIIAVLAVALVLETGYLIGKSRTEDVYKEQMSEMARTGDPRTPLRRKPVRSTTVPAGRKAAVSDRWEAWDPFREITQMRRVMNRMFNDSVGRASRVDGDLFTGLGASFDPAIDVKEQDGSYLVIVDLPGVDKDTIDIKARPNSISISGERTIETEEKDPGGGFYRAERSYGSFSRTIPLMREIVPEDVTAETAEGVLMIKLPKSEKITGEGETGTKVEVE